jgi:FMN phosphatase YigB (HAD superfamily)
MFIYIKSRCAIMELDEEPHALNLVLNSLRRLHEGERLRVMFDIDDTVADTSGAVLRSMGKDAAFRGKTFYSPEIKLEDYIEVYHKIWKEKPTEIAPNLSYESARKLMEETEFRFISARGRTAEAGLLKWLDHNYRGLNIPITIVTPVPYNMHGFHKLKQNLHILVDDAPSVAESMSNGYASGRSLLLVDRWEESVARRNHANTAVVPNSESAAKYILKAVELHAHEIQNKHAAPQDA